MKNFAVEYFKNHKGNCAQSVAAAWLHVHSGEENLLKELSSCGGGKAPGGMCGAVHAACVVTGKNEDVVKTFEFRTGGFSRCAEIKASRSLTCSQAVALAAEIAEKTCGQS